MSKNLEFDFSEETGEIPEEKVKVLSVSALNSMIKQNLEEGFPLVWLKAEVSNFKAHSSGHFYFSLKDEKSQVLAVMFRGSNSRLNFKPKDGMEVIVRGRISVYTPRGNYQILVEKMDAVGAGSLQKAFEDLKLKLQKEGLFDPQHKKPLPFLPKKIALITSPTGAAVRDMVQVLGRRYPAAEILLIPALTQGDAAAQSLMQAVQNLEKLDCDVAIIGRGGGSIEDMWCFNNEALARQLYACKVPIVSAVGHEIDFTICDFVCDMRAPTPSAAAELVSQNVSQLLENLKEKKKALLYYFKNTVEQKRTKLGFVSQRLVDPKKKLQDLRIRCDEKAHRLTSLMQDHLKYQKVKLQNFKQRTFKFKDFLNPLKTNLAFVQKRLLPAFSQHVSNKKSKFHSRVEILNSLNPLSIIHRGFSVVRKKSYQGELVKSAQQIQKGDELWIGWSQGSAKAQLIEIEENKEWEQKTKKSK